MPQKPLRRSARRPPAAAAASDMSVDRTPCSTACRPARSGVREHRRQRRGRTAAARVARRVVPAAATRWTGRRTRCPQTSAAASALRRQGCTSSPLPPPPRLPQRHVRRLLEAEQRALQRRPPVLNCACGVASANGRQRRRRPRTSSVRCAAVGAPFGSRSRRQGRRRTLLHVLLGASDDAAPHRRCALAYARACEDGASGQRRAPRLSGATCAACARLNYWQHETGLEGGLPQTTTVRFELS